MSTNWQDVVITPDTTLGIAIAKIDTARLQVALAVDADGRLAGVLTDGDIRRAILRGHRLEVPVAEVMNRNPTAVPATMTCDEMLLLMRRKVLHHLPLVDAAKRLVGLVTLDELIGVRQRPNWAILMAGGLGTRLAPLTAQLPKPLLPVGGKPILSSIINSFAEQGFKRLFVSVNYKAEMIREQIGDGDRWGATITYLHETTRLGTAGSLSLLSEKPTAPVIVMNADLLTRVNFGALLQFHEAQGGCATMAVREYDFQVPYGVVRTDGTRIIAVEEKPVQKFFVNAGIYVLSPEAFDLVPAGTFFDMPSLFGRLQESGRPTAAYPLREFWIDIGRFEELERAQREWTS